MFRALLSLPTLVGCVTFVVLVTAAGLAVWLLTFRFYSKHSDEAALDEVRDATANLLRVVGWLFTLLLSITFANVAADLVATQNDIQSEAGAISDIHRSVGKFGAGQARGIQDLLVAYTEAVIEDEWASLAHDRLSERAGELLGQLGDALMQLDAMNLNQEALRSRIMADLDAISDHRMSRLHAAREQPSQIALVILFGYLVTMVYFGVYEPRPILVLLVSLYTVFVGVIIYLGLALGDPFNGSISPDPTPLEYALETMRGTAGAPPP